MKIMKIIMCLSVLMLIISPAFAASAELSAGDVSGSEGSSINIPVNLKSSVDIGSLDAVISYNADVLQLESVEKGSLTANSLIDYNVNTAGRVTIAMADSLGVKGEGSVAVLNFKVLGKEGDKSPIAFESSGANEAATLIDVRLDAKAGSFSVSGGIGLEGIIGAAIVILVVIGLVLKRRGSKPK